MARVTAEEFQEKHARRLKAAIPDVVKGVNAVTKSPTAAAADKQDKMLARITEAVQSGKWAKNLRKVSLDEWKEKMITKGSIRISAGIDGAKDKTIAFAKDLLPHVDAGRAKVKTMPDLTIQDSIARAGAFIMHMSEMKRS